MDALKAIREVSFESGVNLSTISKSLGNNRAYLNTTIARGSMPRIDTYVRIMDACNYGVYVISKDNAPKDAIQITDSIER